MLVPREQLAEAEAVAAAAAEKATPGDPFADGTRLGPLVSDAQRERVRGYIKKGKEEGAKLVTGGAEPPEGLESGYFVRPTVFSEVKPDMTIAQEEIFGPVLSIIPYDSEDEAVGDRQLTDLRPRRRRLVGGSRSARSAFARRMRTGQVDINGATFNPLAPFGGYKQSGHGREYGRFGLEEFLEVKCIQPDEPQGARVLSPNSSTRAGARLEGEFRRHPRELRFRQPGSAVTVRRRLRRKERKQWLTSCRANASPS